MKHLMISLVFLNSSFLACGKIADKEEEKNKDKNSASSQAIGAEDLIADTESSTSLIQASLDQSLAAVYEEPDGESNATSLALATEAHGELSRYRHCEVDGDAAVVNIQRKMSRTVNTERPRYVVDFTAALETNVKRTWSHENDSITCHSSEMFANLPLNNMEGMHLKANIKRAVVADYAFLNTRNGNSLSRTFAYSAEGEVNVDWLSQTEADDEMVIEKVVSLDSSYIINVERDYVPSQSFSGNIDAQGDKALKIEVRRDLSSLAVKTRTIQEGSLEIYNDSGKLILNFHDVAFPAGSCQPNSGQVTGSIESATDSSKNLEFTAIYSATAETRIVFSNGNEGTLSMAGCDFELPATTLDSKEPILESQTTEE